MGLPRIHFNGLFKADVSTANNYAENYLIAKYSEDVTYPSWNPNGTGEFTFVDCVVTALVYKNGNRANTREEDPLIGSRIINNPAMVPAKLVDLDSPDHDLSSTLYGMRFGINWSPIIKTGDSFIGDWKPAILSRDVWSRQVNDTTADRYTHTVATQGSSKLINVKWGKLESKALKQLLEGYKETNTLSVSVSVFNYTRPHQESRFLYGVVSGTIGVGTSEESLNFVGERVMQVYNKTPFVDVSKQNTCASSENWMFTAYFSINQHGHHHQTTVTVDFGNSIKIDFGGRVCDFGPLYLAMCVSDTTLTEKVEVIGRVTGYQNPSWYNETGGVIDFHLTDNQASRVSSSLFGVVHFIGMHDHYEPDGNYPVCTDGQKSSPCAYVLLKESRFYLRPIDHHVLRIEAEESILVRLRLREYGLQPKVRRQVKLKDLSPNRPSKGYLTFTNPVTTDENGVAIFNITANKIGRPRGKLEMDGEVFVFGYCVELEEESENADDEDLCEENYTNTISFLAWEKIVYDEPVFWDQHIKPIFQQYERLYPAMRSVLRLGEYEDVVKPHNIQLLIKAMSLSVEHPSYMPVSRDLSPSRVKMILKWLQSEHHYRNWSHVEEILYTAPRFCQEVNYENEARESPLELGFAMNEQATKRRSLRGDDLLANKFMMLPSSAASKIDIPNWMSDLHQNKKCTIAMLKSYLQDAVTLEFSTIPLYLTAMYSLKDG